MKTIVITGSTRGIGKGLALEFLRKGHQVVISGTSRDSVSKALAALQPEYSKEQFAGTACDVRTASEIVALWDFACQQFGKVDIWINNAGISQPGVPFFQVTSEEAQRVLEIDLLGTVQATQLVTSFMQKQGFGAIYNMEGFGSDGRTMKGMTIYGTAKRGVRYFTEACIAETKGSPVHIGLLSPGMVLTDFLLSPLESNPEKFAAAANIYAILADPVEPVTAYLVHCILTKGKHGAKFYWLTTPKIIFRFLTAAYRKKKRKELVYAASKASSGAALKPSRDTR